LTETASAADYDRFAAEFLANAEASVARMRPAGEIAVFLWRGTWRVGAVQPLGYETVALVSVNGEPLEDWVRRRCAARAPACASSPSTRSSRFADSSTSRASRAITSAS
jgi:hypothetical protein